MSLCIERRSISGDSPSESVSVLERRPRRPGPRVRRRWVVVDDVAMPVGGMRRLRAAGRGERGVMAEATVRWKCWRSCADGARGSESVRTCGLTSVCCDVPTETTSISSSVTIENTFNIYALGNAFETQFENPHLPSHSSHFIHSLRSHHHKRRASIVMPHLYTTTGLDLGREARCDCSSQVRGKGWEEHGRGEGVDPIVLPQRLPSSIQTPDVTARHSRQNDSACAVRCGSVHSQWTPDYQPVDTLSGLRFCLPFNRARFEINCHATAAR